MGIKEKSLSRRLEKHVKPGLHRVHIVTPEMIKVPMHLTGPILVKLLPRVKTTVVIQITQEVYGVIPQIPAAVGNTVAYPNVKFCDLCNLQRQWLKLPGVTLECSLRCAFYYKQMHLFKKS